MNFNRQNRHKNTALLVVIAIIFFAAVGYLGRDILASIKDAAMDKYSANKIKEISAQELKQRMEENEDLLLIDVRTQEEYEWEHIEGAVSIPLNELSEQYDQLNKKQEIVTVCDNSECEYSRIAARRLQKQGFKNVRALTEGIPAWLEAGYSTIKSEDAQTVENVFKVQPITENELNEAQATMDLYIIDLRSEENRNNKAIENAQVYNKNNFEQEIENLPNDKTIILLTDNSEDTLKYGGLLFDNGFLGVRYLTEEE